MSSFLGSAARFLAIMSHVFFLQSHLHLATEHLFFGIEQSGAPPETHIPIYSSFSQLAIFA
jgi:hypothetical protein